MMLNVQEEEEGNVLVNDTLNTFLIQLYGIRHMVNDHCRALHGLLFPVSSKGSFVCFTLQKQDSTCHILCYTSRVALA